MSSFQACYHYLVPLLVAGLAGCQLLGWNGEPEQPRETALRGRAQETLDYPSLHTVPPRPDLSYTVEQRREIVERLINDRAYARYTEQRVRFESGLSSLPPPPEPPQAAAEAEADRVVGARSDGPADRPDQASVEQDATATGYSTFDSDAAQTDDGTLSDFMRDLVRDTVPPPAPEEPAAPDDAAASPPEQDAANQDSAPAPPAPEAEAAGETEPRALGELLAWIGDLFGGEEASAPAPSAAAAMAPSPSKPSPPAGAAVIAVPAPLPPPSKPASAVSPPPPGPAKPVLAQRPAPGDLATVSFSPGSATLAAGVDALLERAWELAAGAPVELHARGGGHALAADRARAVALALFRMGAMPGDLELLVSGTGPGEVHLVATTGSS